MCCKERWHPSLFSAVWVCVCVIVSSIRYHSSSLRCVDLCTCRLNIPLLLSPSRVEAGIPTNRWFITRAWQIVVRLSIYIWTESLPLLQLGQEELQLKFFSHSLKSTYSSITLSTQANVLFIMEGQDTWAPHWQHTGWINVLSTTFQWNYVKPTWNRRWINPVGQALGDGMCKPWAKLFIP